VSVERLFSSLKILKSDHRNRLGEKLLNAMLLLRSNMANMEQDYCKQEAFNSTVNQCFFNVPIQCLFFFQVIKNVRKYVT
jgi:hypothetical protein